MCPHSRALEPLTLYLWYVITWRRLKTDLRAHRVLLMSAIVLKTSSFSNNHH